MKYLKSAALLGFLATPVFAQDSAGTVTGTLDFDEVRWAIASFEDGPATSFEQDDATTQIRLVGTSEAGGETGPGTLIIDITAAGGATDPGPTDVRMELRLENGALFAEDANVDLSLEAFEMADDDLVVAGSFTTTLTQAPRAGLVISPDAGTPFTGNFQATIRGGTLAE